MKVTEPRAQLDEGVWNKVIAPSSGIPPSVTAATEPPKRPVLMNASSSPPLYIAFAEKCVLNLEADAGKGAYIREQGYSFRLSNTRQSRGLILLIMQILTMSLAP